ncbi:MAG: hypothetical protein BJ554DRAFT_6995 [Olpidium bornovanus]|uniref:Uncharacterized protein n=1 Tax=Olpidium bornovanus TaxID=278681 RepID=A0A8H7ZWT8_9FUNG|nr:MAG: hypothetical protein BJ554DRAFT_6995 [Olpidium bornovanus]
MATLLLTKAAARTTLPRAVAAFGVLMPRVAVPRPPLGRRFRRAPTRPPPSRSRDAECISPTQRNRSGRNGGAAGRLRRAGELLRNAVTARARTLAQNADKLANTTSDSLSNSAKSVGAARAAVPQYVSAIRDAAAEAGRYAGRYVARKRSAWTSGAGDLVRKSADGPPRAAKSDVNDSADQSEAAEDAIKRTGNGISSLLTDGAKTVVEHTRRAVGVAVDKATSSVAFSTKAVKTAMGRTKSTGIRAVECADKAGVGPGNVATDSISSTSKTAPEAVRVAGSANEATWPSLSTRRMSNRVRSILDRARLSSAPSVTPFRFSAKKIGRRWFVRLSVVGCAFVFFFAVGSALPHAIVKWLLATEATKAVKQHASDKPVPEVGPAKT